MTREEIIKGLEGYIPWADEYEVDIEVLTGALELLKKEPCDDAISRDAVWDVMQELWGTSGELIDRLMALPSVNPQEPKTGHWIRMKAYEKWECSECNTVFRFPFKEHDYCPNCGCRMVEPQESEE